MEEKVCLHQNFGFCKYKEACKKSYIKDQCKYLSNCISKKTCEEEKNPKLCRRYDLDKLVVMEKM